MRLQHGHSQHSDTEHSHTLDGETKVAVLCSESFVEDASSGTLMWVI